MGKGIRILHEDCDPTVAEDRSLPYTAYLVQYKDNDKVKFDISTAAKRVDIFDYYWDKFRSVMNMTQTQGRVNPKLWGNSEKKSKKK
jgi:ribosomal protein L21E|tara:strand:- start:223 stop:483 length:261 start_codon:yes stop_codon:yes gene_type:complete